MRKSKSIRLIKPVVWCTALLWLAGCAAAPAKKNYMLNYVPDPMQKRLKDGAYPYVIWLKGFDIEEAYKRPQIVYRRSPFEIEYYFYRVWAVDPKRMITDLVHKHLLAVNLTSAVVRRLGEGANPDFELNGMIEAIEEYDSENIWFAHIALRLWLMRTSDGKVLYNRRFDNRKRVFENKPEYVIKELSQIMEFIMNQVMRDLDVVLAKEYGVNTAGAEPAAASPDSTIDTPEMWK